MKSRVHILFLLLICGCATPRIDEYNRYYNYQYKFTIKFPWYWKIEKGKKPICVMSIRNDNNAQVNVVASKLPKTMNLNDYFYLNVKYARDSLPGFHEGKIDSFIVNGHPAKGIIFVLKKNIVSAKIMQVYLVNNNYGYTISCNAGIEDFDKYETDFTSIINSVHFPPYK